MLRSGSSTYDSSEHRMFTERGWHFGFRLSPKPFNTETKLKRTVTAQQQLHRAISTAADAAATIATGTGSATFRQRHQMRECRVLPNIKIQI